MTVQGYIRDSTTNAGIPSASVTVVTAQGNSLNKGTAADGNGYFSIISPDLDTGGKLMMSSVGYKSVIVDPNVIVSTGFVNLDQDPDTLATVTVTPGGGQKTNYVPWLLGAGALFFLVPDEKKKKKGKMGDIGKNWETLAVTGGIAVGAYFFVVKPILAKLGIGVPAADKATTDAQADALAAAKLAAQQSGSTGATYTADQYTGWANDIYTLGGSDTPVSQDNQQKIVNDVISSNTMVDLQTLISAFGVKPIGGSMLSWCGLFGAGCQSVDLPTFLKMVLDTIHLNYINSYLSAQHINYTF